MYMCNRDLKFNFYSKLKFFIVIACVISLLPACTFQIQREISGTEFSEERANLDEINTWTWNGKFVLKGADFSHSGSLTWKKKADKNYIFIKGPMGVGIARFVINRGQIINIKNSGSEEMARIIEVLETELPLDMLNRWLLGIEQNNLETTHDQTGLLNLQRYKGGIVIYKNWREYQDTLLPSEIILKTKFAEIRLVTLNWIPEQND